MTDGRPNILIITTDQQRWDALSLWGSPGYRTPNIDRIGADGVVFDRAYSPSPVCTPARISMITGQYSTRHGSWTIGMVPVPALEGPTIGSLLGAAGYHTAIIGKTHFVARSIEDQHVAGVPLDSECPGSNFWSAFDGPYCGFEFVRHHRHHNTSGVPNAHYRAWLERKGLNLDDVHAAGRPYKGFAGPWTGMKPEWTQNAWITEETTEYLDRIAGDGRPWCVMANYQDPHYPMVCPEPYYSDVDMSDVDLGGVSEGEFDDKPPFYKRFIEGQGWSDPDGRQFAEEFNVPDTRLYDFFSAPEAIRAYIGMCNMVDDYVGGLLTYLEQSGRLDNTLVIYTADHGDMLGRHGMWYKGLPAYDDQQRIPALAMWRAGAARGGVSRRETSSYSGSANGATARRAPPAAAANHTRSHFSLVDILPTALDAAGLDPVPYVQGVSQLPVITGRAESVRDWALVDHVASTRIRQQTFVHDEWKLVCYNHADYGELYNLAVDPDQMENLWNDPSAGDRKSAMLLRLAQASMDTVGVLPRRINHA